MNSLTAVQVAARNLYAHTYGVDDPAMIELGFLNPAIANSAEELAAAVLAGPAGSLTIDDSPLAAAESCGCQGIDGYVQALTETLEHIGSIPAVTMIEAQCYAQLIADITARLADVTGDQMELPVEEDTTTSGTDALASALSAIFGFPVQVVQLEPSSR